MLEQAWLTFRGGLYEIRTLVEAAEAASNVPAGGRLVTEQQAYVRAAIVLLAAHLEGFLRAIPDEYTDQIDEKSWNSQLSGVQRFIALQATHRLTKEIEKAGACENVEKRDQLRRSIVATARWFTSPTRIAESQLKPRLTGLYQQRSAKAIELFLLDFHPGPIPFFHWLASRGLDRSRFMTVVEGLIYARNEIAHGNGQLSLTLADLRGYLAACIVLVRQTRVYVSY